jgi:hypothetical protein
LFADNPQTGRNPANMVGRNPLPCIQDAMLFRWYKPVPPLSDFIEHFWLYEAYASAYVHERILPTGSFEMVFNLCDNQLRIYEDEPVVLLWRPSDAFSMWRTLCAIVRSQLHVRATSNARTHSCV